MVVIINGSFGVGKSSVAKLLRRSLPRSTVYDPEWAGLVLMHIAKLIPFKGSGTDDFQDLNLWRKLTVAGIRLFSKFHSGPVIVPMTFTSRDYFDEVIGSLRNHGHEVRAYCLKSTETTLAQRLAKRGLKNRTAASDWINQRNSECLIAHHDPHFGAPVDTETRSAREVADYITVMLCRPTSD